jgi:SNF2 family DNA or RNA helicase
MISNSQRVKRLWTFLTEVFTSELDEESSRFEEQPPYIRPTLYTHQKTLLRASLDLEKTKFNGLDCGNNSKLFANFGVIADRVGSGKSLVALSLVKFPPPEEDEIHTAHRGPYLAMVQYKKPELQKRRVRAALFIVPHSLMSQWEEYVTRDTELSAIFCRKRREASDPTIPKFLDTVDVVFISSTMYKFFEETVKPESFHWSRIFIDEADSITVPIKTNLTANFTWLITASYLNIAFPTGLYLRLDTTFNPIPDTVEPQLLERIRKINGNDFRVDGVLTNSQFIKTMLGSTDISKNVELSSWRIVKRNSDAFVDNSFIMPPIINHKLICKPTANIRILESLIPNEVMEMLHAGDTKGALQALGVKDETPTKIIDSVTRTLRRELEQQKRRLEFYQTQDYSSEGAKQKSLEAQVQKISSLETRIETIEKRMENLASTNCPICYSDVETPSMTPCCTNLFCFGCLCESLKRNQICPLCREPIASIADISVINSGTNTISDTNMVEDVKQPKTKIEEFLNFVETHPEARVLLFSGYDATFFQLTSEMSHRNITHSLINGSTARVSKLISEFSEGNYRVLLLNSRHVGAGLNIVSATDVFLFHKMNSEMEKQIIGRAYRMGRTKPLNVHHLLHSNEV